jgi:hypothetical protein
LRSQFATSNPSVEQVLGGPPGRRDAGSGQLCQHDSDVVLQFPASEPGPADERGARRFERPDGRRLGDSSTMLARVANALGVSPADLLDESRPK